MALERKEVGGDLRLEYDLADGWVMIVDKDGGDFPGVLVSTVVLDRLIVALGELRPQPVNLDAVAGAEIVWVDDL